jgi:sigma-B regulation protein RsbU (phosphoserine phosphatase)
VARAAQGVPPDGGGVPAPRRAVRFAVPDAVLTEGVAALAGAGGTPEVAAACLPLLVALPGVRAVAVLRRDGAHAVVLGSAGYECGSLAPGATLPLDAGLPATEALRSGRPVVQGTGPGWVALPFGRGRQRPGSLLLSLDAAPPDDPAVLSRLQRLARALGDALHRADDQEQLSADLSVVHAALVPTTDTDPDCEVVQRWQPVAGDVGGDVLASLSDGRGGSWLVAADVVGYGLAAALVARSVRTAVRAAAPFARGPAHLLDLLERTIAPDVGPGCFVTALAVHLSDDGLRAASAGHPPPVLLSGRRAEPVVVDPGPPLALEGMRHGQRRESVVPVRAGTAVLLHTDGLTERRAPDGVRLLDATDLARGLPSDLEEAADALLAAADAVGPAEDDVSVLLARWAPAADRHDAPPA